MTLKVSVCIGFILYFILHSVAVYFVLRQGHLPDTTVFVLKSSYVVATIAIIVFSYAIGTLTNTIPPIMNFTFS